jgi:thiosulfate dehydrogenase [quinone] large subunit
MEKQTMTGSKNSKNESNLDLTFAALALRIYVGLQVLLAGVDKFMVNGAFGGIAGYKVNMLRMADGISGGSIMLPWMTRPYALVLPWVLLLSGIAILLGIKNRIALSVAALTYISLSIGLALVREDVWHLGIYLGLTAAALCLNKYNRFALLKDK